MPVNGYKKTGRTMLDFIMAAAEAERKGGITLEEWTNIRRHGTPEEIAEYGEYNGDYNGDYKEDNLPSI